jgi:hypothetical protein
MFVIPFGVRKPSLANFSKSSQQWNRIQIPDCLTPKSTLLTAIFKIIVKISGFQNSVPKTAAAATPGTLFQLQVVNPQPRPIKPEILRVGPSNP